MSGATVGAAAGVAASGDQTEGAEGEDNKGEHLLSCTSSLMLPVKWRIGDVCCLTYFTQTLIHHKMTTLFYLVTPHCMASLSMTISVHVIEGSLSNAITARHT